MGAGLDGHAHLRIALRRPAIPGETSERYMQFGARFGIARMAVEQPLRWIIGIRVRQAVRVFLGSDLLPMREIERRFDQYAVVGFRAWL